MTTNFVSNRAGSQYVLLCIATFLCFLTTSTLTLLSVIFDQQAYSSQQIGFVLSSPVVPVLVALLVSEFLSRKFGQLRIMIVGQLLTTLAFICLEYGSSNFTYAFMLRAVIGFGFGLYFTASMVYARQILTGPNLLYYFGIFVSMIPLPNAIGPYIAETYINHLGVQDFFIIMSAPSIAGLCILFCLYFREEITQKSTATNFSQITYRQVLSNRSFVVPALGIFLLA